MPSPQRPNRRVGVVALAVVLLLGGTAWWLLRSKGKDESLAAAATNHAPAPVAPAPVEADSNATQHVAPTRAAVPTPLAELDDTRPAPESFTRELSGLHGRLVESDGKPVAGVPVELIELRFEAVLASFESGFQQLPADVTQLDVGHATSAQDGTFELHGAMAASMHVLGVDLGGARATFRLLDVALERGKSCDLGDVVLPSGTTLVGTVTDEDGAPVADARVRVLPDLQLPIPIPPMIFDSADVQDIRSDCSALVVATKEPVRMKIDAPPALRFLIDRLPLPTTHTGSDGKFQLAHVAPGVVTLLADQPKRLGAVKAGVAVPRGRDEVNVGALGLQDGRTVTGRFVDGETPIAGAKVCVGTVLPIPGDEGKLAVGQPAGVTDADGTFKLTGLPLNGELICAAQRRAGGPWQVFGPFTQDDVKLECPPTATLMVLVQDAATKPVEHAELRLVDASNPVTAMVQLGAPSKIVGVVREMEPGHYEVSEQPLGKWTVLARSADSGIGKTDVEVVRDGSIATITLPAPRNLAVKVVDAATQQPVDFALATALVGDLNRGPNALSLAAARTNRDGLASLRQLPNESKLAVRVVHPGYVTQTMKVDNAKLAELSFALKRGGDFAGKVTCGGEAPGRPLMFILTPRDRDLFDFMDVLPRFAATLPDGTFHVRHLEEGKWRWSLYRRFFDVGPVDLLKTAMGGDMPDELKDGEVEIAEGKETNAEIATESLDDRATGTLRGVVRLNGEMIEGLQVQTEGRRSRHAKTDASGRFELTEVRSGNVVLEVADQREGRGQTIGQREVELRAGETKEVEFDLRPATLTVTVRDPEGNGVPQVNLWAYSTPSDGVRQQMSASGTTDQKGQVTLLVSPAKWHLQLRSQGFSPATTELEVSDQDRVRTLDVTLERGVAVAGTVVFDGKEPGDEWCYLSVEPERGETEPNAISYGGDVGAELKAPDHRFELKGLKPGRHRASVWSSSDVEFEPVTFDVGPAGETNLVLRFKPKS